METASLLAFLCVILLLCAHFRVRFEEAAMVVVSGWVLILFLLAMVGRLQWIDWVSVCIVVMTIGALLWGILRGHINRKTVSSFVKARLWTPGFVVVAALGLFFLWSCSHRHIDHPDEVNYWGTFARSLWVSGGFVDGLRHCTPAYATYMPGMQLLQWNVMHIAGGWHEGLLYTTLYLTGAVYLLPLLADVTWRDAWKAALFAVAAVIIPLCLSSAYYALLSPDGVLGMMFGCALLTGGRKRQSTFSRLQLVGCLCTMMMVKESGLPLVCLTVVYLLLVRPKGRRLRTLWYVAAPLALLAIWRLYCTTHGYMSFAGRKLADIATAIHAGTWTLPPDFGRITSLFLRAMVLSAGNKAGMWGSTAALFGLPLVGWIMLFVALPFLLRGQARRAGVPEERQLLALESGWRYAVFPLIALVYFVLFMILCYATVFAPELPYYDANSVSMAERYASSILLGLFILSASMVLVSRPSKRARALLLTAAGLAMLFLCDWTALENLLPSVYEQRFPDRINADVLRQEGWLSALSDPADTRVLNLTDEWPDVRGYALPPISFVGMPMSVEDALKDPEIFGRSLAQMGVTHLLVRYRDDERLHAYGELFGMKLRTGGLYAVDTTHGRATLVSLYP